jgi:hypothetical protein
MNSGSGPASLLREIPRAGLRSMVDQRRPIVVILGMHRSGTSLCSHVLSALGVDMADTVAARNSEETAPDNPKGHWERWEIVDFHDRILGLLNRPYAGIGHDFVFPVAWWADPRVASVRREIMAFLERRMGNGQFGFKDPRTVRLLPIWHQIFADLKLAPKIVYCIRNPAQVARSLHARDGLNRDLGEYRWLSYNTDFFRYIRAHEFCTIEYESWFDERLNNLAKLRAFLDLPAEQDDSYIDDAVSEIIDGELRHDDSSFDAAGHPLIRSIYKLARRAQQDAGARNQLQNIAAEFLSFQQLQAAFQRDSEHNAKLAARVPGLEQGVTALRASLDERNARIDAARLEFATRDSQLRELETEFADVRAALAAEVSALRNAAAKAEREAHESRILTEQRETEAVSSLQREITELRSALSRAELSVRTAECRVAEAEQNAEFAERKSSEAARNAADLESRITTLTTELASARKVGRTALQALRVVSGTDAVLREPRLGWRQKTRQLFGIRVNP